MLENFPASLGRHIQIAEPCRHRRAITKRKGVNAGVSGVRIAQDMNVGFVNDALVKGFLGIGAAPEFLENLMWKKFTKKMKEETIRKGIYQLKHGNYEYPITLQLIKDGRKNKVLNKKINSNIKVTMVHGEKDEAVPVSYSRKVLKLFPNAEKKLNIVEKGDHSLSNRKWLNILLKELK